MGSSKMMAAVVATCIKVPWMEGQWLTGASVVYQLGGLSGMQEASGLTTTQG